MTSNVLFVSALLTSQLLASGTAIGTLTLREGSLRLIRGANVLQAVEGIPLLSGDIIESSEKGFAQLELAGGTILAVGPETRLLLLSYGSGDRSGASFFLLNGWLKGEGCLNSACRYLTPLLGLTTKGGTVILHASPEASQAFLESGTGTAGMVSGGGTVGAGAPAKAGQFLVRKAGKPLTSGSRPEPEFVQSMPAPFRDTLPSRLARFAGKNIEPKKDHEVSYADVDSWLRIAPAWRHGFVGRFRTRLRDPQFRSSLDAHMSEHPEWDPILHPEKYQKDEPPANAGASAPPGR